MRGVASLRATLLFAVFIYAMPLRLMFDTPLPMRHAMPLLSLLRYALRHYAMPRCRRYCFRRFCRYVYFATPVDAATLIFSRAATSPRMPC